MEFLLYLAGPIKGISYEETTSWRNYVAERLPDCISPLSPMRSKLQLRHEKEIIGEYSDPLCSPSGFTCRDRFDVMRSDAILMNFLEAKNVSIGSVVELGWADLLRKPVIVVMEEDNVHNHLMLRQIASYFLPTLDEAIEVAVAILLPGADH